LGKILFNVLEHHPGNRQRVNFLTHEFHRAVAFLNEIILAILRGTVNKGIVMDRQRAKPTGRNPYSFTRALTRQNIWGSLADQRLFVGAKAAQVQAVQRINFSKRETKMEGNKENIYIKVNEWLGINSNPYTGTSCSRAKVQL
jgi:hypothetical protein